MTEDIEYHAARLLVLMVAMNPRSGHLEGLTKLAKLDFLLRYPAFLERVLQAREITWPEGLEPSDAERLAVESRMIRYKYGPWDDKYYPIIGFLVGTDLVQRTVNGGRVDFSLTKGGRGIAKQLAVEPSWARVSGRARLLRKHFNLTGSALRELIYVELPEVVDVPLRTTI